MSLTFNSGVKWSENAADYRNLLLERSRKNLRTQFSTSLEKIRLDLFFVATTAFREATRIVRVPFSFSKTCSEQFHFPV